MRTIFLSILLLIGCGLVASCQRFETEHYEGFVFGTRIELIIAEPPSERNSAVKGKIFAELDRLHREYHAWQPSQVSVLNEGIARHAIPKISTELAQLITDNQALCRLSDQRFDPGIGKLIALWGFQSDELPQYLPDKTAIQTWLEQPASILALTIKPAESANDENQVISSSDRVALDFGGYLKGYALDRAVSILKTHQVNNALINIGGNVYAMGSRAPNTSWTIGIQHPRQSSIIATLTLHDGEAVGTSGDYQRFFGYEGKRYHHLLDPRTGYPAKESQAVTILIRNSKNASNTGVLSDYLSKPLFIAGKNWLGMYRKLVEKLGPFDVLFIDQDGAIEVTENLATRLVMTNPQQTIKKIAASTALDY